MLSRFYVQVDQTVEQQVAEGKRLLEAGDKPAALEQFMIALDLAPSNETAWLLRAKATDDPKQAAECLERVLSINPENAQAREDLIYLRMHGLQEGVRGFTNTVAAVEPGIGISASVGRLLTSPWARIGLGVIALAFCGLSCLTLILAGNRFITTPDAQPIARSASASPTLFILPGLWTPTSTRAATRTPPPLPSLTPSARAKVSLAVRAGPSVNFSRLGTLTPDSKMIILGRSLDGKFIAIAYPDVGKIGWVLVDYVDLGGMALDALAITAPPPITPAPVRPIVAAATPTPKPTSTPSPSGTYGVYSRGCQHSGGTFIEGFVTNPNGEEAGTRVTLGRSPGANVIQTVTTGSDRSPGYYTFHLNDNGPYPGTYYVWIADVSGQVLSDPNAARVTTNAIRNGEDPGACWQAFVDFARR